MEQQFSEMDSFWLNKEVTEKYVEAKSNDIEFNQDREFGSSWLFYSPLYQTGVEVELSEILILHRQCMTYKNFEEYYRIWNCLFPSNDRHFAKLGGELIKDNFYIIKITIFKKILIINKWVASIKKFCLDYI